MKKAILSAVVLTILSSSLFGATKSECQGYESKFSRYIDKFNSNSNSTKKYPLIMVKSYLDSILTECNGVIDVSFYKKQKPTIKKMWNKYIPKQTRDLPQNQWK